MREKKEREVEGEKANEEMQGERKERPKKTTQTGLFAQITQTHSDTTSHQHARKGRCME